MKPFLCKLGLHKWKYVYDCYPDTFLDEELTSYWKAFRTCTRCGEVQELFYDMWVPIKDKRKKKILFSKIIDKGNFYLLSKCLE